MSDDAYPTDALAALVLAWAKAERPDAYAATLAVAARPKAYRAYLVRLLELRYAAEPVWRGSVPLRALDATSLALTFARPDGTRFTVGGRAVPGRDLRFATLATLETTADLDLLLAASAALDLEMLP